MARNFARIDVTIWMDEDFRDLPPEAQHLYFILWTHPKLSYCGVVDWRPAKLSGLAGGWSRDDVERAAGILSDRLFIVLDLDTEECLIRSWAKHDGLIKEPRMAVSFVNSYAEVASRTLQGVIVHEAKKLRDAQPTLAGWLKPQMVALLIKHDIDPASLALAPTDPSHSFPPVSGAFGVGLGIGRDGVSGSVSGTPTPSPAPTPSPSPGAPEQSVNDDDELTSKRKPERRLPATWAPTAAHLAFATEKHVSIEEAVKTFRNHADTNDRRCRNWNGAFHTWLDKSKPLATGRPGSSLWDRPPVGSQP